MTLVSTIRLRFGSGMGGIGLSLGRGDPYTGCILSVRIVMIRDPDRDSVPGPSIWWSYPCHPERR